MSLTDVPAVKSLPDDFNVIVEIPANADPINYEIAYMKRTMIWIPIK